jgi:hypothetical protein
MNTNYLLRDIDVHLWQRVKTRAHADGLRLRAVILALLRSYASGAIRIDATEEK